MILSRVRKLKSLRAILALALFAACFSVFGCGSSDPASRVAAMNDSNIRRVANLYMAHQTRKGGIGPKDEAAFKEFVRSGIAPHRLEMMQIDPAKVDELFISERDGQPFEIRFSQSGGLTSKIPVVFEKQGVDGLRQVAFTGGDVEEVDAAKYDELLKGKVPVASTPPAPNP